MTAVSAGEPGSAADAATGVGAPVRKRALPILIVTLALITGALGFDVHLDSGGDNAEYLALAKSMADGRGYRMIALPGEPIETKRWPGLPLLLTPFMWLAPDALWLPKATGVLAFAVAAALSWSLVRMQSEMSEWLVLAAVLIFVLNDRSIEYASTLYAEVPFTLAGIGALLALERAASGQRRSWGFAAGAVVLIVAAVYIRPNGIALIPAAFAFLLVRARWKTALIVSGLATVLVVPWMARESLATAEGGHTYASAALGHTEEDAPGATGAAKWAYRIRRNAAAQTLAMGQLVLARPQHVGFRPVTGRTAHAEPVSDAPAQPRVDSERDSAGLDPGRLSRYLLAAIVLLGAIVTWRGGGRSIHWYVIFTVLMLLLIPWPRGRYLFPLLPFFGWFLVAGLLWSSGLTARWLGAQRAYRLGAAAVAGACVLALLLTAMAVSQQATMNLRNRGLPYWAPERYEMQGPDLVQYMEAAEWILTHTPEDAVVACRKPFQIYWVTGRKANMVWAHGEDRVWSGFQDLTQHGPLYVIEDAFGDRFGEEALTETYWEAALSSHPDRCAVVFETDDRATKVWRVVGSEGTGVSLGLTETGT